LSAAEENGSEAISPCDVCRVRIGDVKRFGTFILVLGRLMRRRKLRERRRRSQRWKTRTAM